MQQKERVRWSMSDKPVLVWSCPQAWRISKLSTGHRSQITTKHSVPVQTSSLTGAHQSHLLRRPSPAKAIWSIKNDTGMLPFYLNIRRCTREENDGNRGNKGTRKGQAKTFLNPPHLSVGRLPVRLALCQGGTWCPGDVGAHVTKRAASTETDEQHVALRGASISSNYGDRASEVKGPFLTPCGCLSLSSTISVPVYLFSTSHRETATCIRTPDHYARDMDRIWSQFPC